MIKYQDIQVNKYDYDNKCLIFVHFRTSKGHIFNSNEIELGRDMDIELVAEKFRRLATQIENMYTDEDTKGGQNANKVKD